MRFNKLWHRAPSAAAEGPAAPGAGPDGAAPGEVRTVVELDEDQLRELSAVFAAPRWLRDLGFAAWLLVGVAALLVGLMWILGITSTITEPVLLGLVLATVTAPGVSWLKRKGLPRAAGAGIVLLALIALAVVIVLLVVGGIAAESDQIAAQASKAVDKIASWAKDTGVDDSAADDAANSVEASAGDVLHTFIHGVAKGISGLASLGFFLSFTVFSLFMLLKDGPKLRAWVERHLGVPPPVANTITSNVIKSMRRYFLGTSIVAGFNAIVVGVGSWILDVPLAGTIAVVTFVTAFVPFIGAIVSGAFAVLLALGSEGTTTALIMLVIVLLANGLLQNIVSPIAMGAALNLNPLLILVVTISAGAFFGMVGMILAAPLTAAAVHISADLARARAAERATLPEPSPEAEVVIAPP
jgi:predicted PurR-regulated permease PerM